MLAEVERLHADVEEWKLHARTNMEVIERLRKDFNDVFRHSGRVIQESAELKQEIESQHNDIQCLEKGNTELKQRLEKQERDLSRIKTLALYCLGPTRDVKTPKIQEISAIANQILEGSE